MVAAEEERHKADACDHGANAVDSRAGVALPQPTVMGEGHGRAWL